MDFSNVSATHLDVLREVCNIGAGNAATSLSKMLNRKIDLKVPNSSVISLDGLLNIFGDEEEIVISVMCLIEGEITGFMIFMLPRMTVGELLSPLLGKEYPEDCEFDAMDMSAIEEIGNIIVSSYINSLALMTGYNIRVSHPFSAVDMVASVLSVPLAEVGKYSDNVLFMESVITCDDVEHGGHFLMLPSIESYEKIMKALGM